MSKRPYLISTVVWSEEYVRLFEEITLPSLLAEKNIPALAGTGSKFFIHTDISGMERLKHSPIVKDLGEYVTFNFKPVVDELCCRSPNKYDLMNHCHEEAIHCAAEMGAPLLFVFPDHVFSGNAVERCMSLRDEGYRAVMVATPRLKRESAAPALRAKRNGSKALCLSSRELVRFAADHLHRWALAMNWDSDEFFHQNPTHLYFGNPKDGQIARCWHLTPLMVHPQKSEYSFEGTVDGFFVSAACDSVQCVHVVTDSDELVYYDLTEEAKYEDIITPGTATADNAIQALIKDIDEYHFYYFGHKIRFRTNDNDLSDVERYSDSIAEQVVSAAKKYFLAQR